MIEQISLLTVDLIGHISCLLLCTALFRRTCAKRQLVLAFLGTLAAGYLITVVPVIREFPIKAILLVMVFTVFCHACYEGKILTQCLCAVFSYVIMLALDTAAIFLFCNWVGMPREQIFADPQLYMICALFSYIVIFVVSFAIWRFAQSWTKIEKISVSGFLAMLVFPLVSLGTITFLFQVTAKDHSVSHWAIVNALGLVAANAVLMGLLHHIEQEAEERKQNVALQHQFETQLEKTQVLLEAQTAQRKQTHDFKHHLSVLGGLLQEENLAAARQYLAEISETGQLDALAVHSNNPVVDAILNQKYAQACELGIQVDFAINDLAEFPLSNKETVVVLSNLLDNAIEACKTQKGTRLIRVKIQCSEEKTILCTTPLGRKRTVRAKLAVSAGVAVLIAAASCLPHLIQVLRDYGLPALFAPAMSISEFESLPALFTLSDVLLFWFVCRIAACLCMGAITLTLGRVFGNLLPALFVSAVGYCLPALLSLSGMDGGIEWLGFWPLFHAANFFTTQGYAGEEGLPYNNAWVILLLLVVVLLGTATLWGYLRDCYEWKGSILDAAS